MRTYEEGLAEGRTQGQTEGRQSATSELQTQTTQAASEASKAERARIQGILASPEAKGREDMASHLAYNTEMSVADAEAMLKVAPKAAADTKGKTPKQSPADATGAQILDHLRATSPNIKHVEGDEGAGGEEGRISEIQANLKGYRDARAQAKNRVPYPV